ncbi:hypothetical protein [Spirochaeta isovalerica]|uniref:Lipoprotein n=1 Tax=Spirochaeta isovalerica TaxID=150 RepID=A0A841RGP2_9SPIO|nr:hypothetical protein [Spirochaeta isovalerica]MBB6481492.1 hypothetical protein [Spirochaeta isovalerica]
MRKRISFLVKILAIGALLFSLSGCLWLLTPDGYVTIQVRNNSLDYLYINVYVYDRAAGDYLNNSDPMLQNLYTTGTFIVPRAGAYDIYITPYGAPNTDLAVLYNQYWDDTETSYDEEYTFSGTSTLLKTY